ncbi:MAG: hypothetical protein K6F63_10550 [Lachnospiraceae bacterium]|nr:hypothetical protein [Lachnospiraceae bacterium]
MKRFKIMMYMIKNGMQSKPMLFMSLFFVMLGVAFEIGMTPVNLGNNYIMPLSSIYFALVGLFIYQLLVTPTFFGVVGASPQKRFLRVTASSLSALLVSLAANTIFILIRVFITIGVVAKGRNLDDVMIEKLYMAILFTGLLCVFGFIYLSFSFTHMIVSLVCFLVFTAGITLLFGGSVLDKIYHGFYAPILERLGKTGTHALVIVSCYAMLLLGSLISYIISNVNYRKCFSPGFTKNIGNLH